jgi:hypothetical protein
VAITVTLMLEVQVGALRTPELEIDPALVDQVTAVFVVPFTLAVNCLVPPDETVALLGDTEMDTAAGASTVTVAEADWLVSA